MIEKIKIEVVNNPYLSEIISDKLNNMGYFINISNLLYNKHYPTVSKLDEFINKQNSFIEFLIEIENEFEYEVTPNYVECINAAKLTHLIEKDTNYDLLNDLVENTEKKFGDFLNLDRCLHGIALGYIANWKNLTNIRVLHLQLKEGMSEYQKAFNIAVCREYRDFLNSDSLNAFLYPLLNKYYNGYIMNDEILRNLFMSRVRYYAYMSENNVSKVRVEKLVECILDTDYLYKKRNRNFVEQCYKILIDFCQKKFSDSKILEDESEVFIAHSKIIGLVGLVRELYEKFTFLSENVIFDFYKNFFEEIHCDCGVFSKSDMSFIVPSHYIHWILMGLILDERISSIDAILRTNKERIFLSKRVHDFIEIQGENIWSNRRASMDIIKLKFSDFNYKVIQPFCDIYGLDVKVMRKEYFDERKFIEVIQEAGEINSDELYELYTNINRFAYKNYDKNALDRVLSIHSSLAINEITQKIISILTSGFSSNEKMEAFLLMETLYPFNANIQQELAILYDEIGRMEDALKHILYAIKLEFDNDLLWQSLNVILHKINKNF